MPWLLRGLAWLLRGSVGAIFGNALLWLGFSLVTQEVIVQPTVAALESFAAGAGGNGTGPYWAVGLAWMGVLNFDRALTMLVSAVAIRKAAQGAKAFLSRRGV